jgi:hypothetical protein
LRKPGDDFIGPRRIVIVREIQCSSQWGKEPTCNTVTPVGHSLEVRDGTAQQTVSEHAILIERLLSVARSNK